MSNPQIAYERLPTEEDLPRQRSIASTTSSIDNLVKSNKIQLHCATAGIMIGQILCIGGLLVLPNFLQDIDRAILLSVGSVFIVSGIVLLFLALNVFIGVHKQLAVTVGCIISESFGTVGCSQPSSIAVTSRRSSPVRESPNEEKLEQGGSASSTAMPSEFHT